MNWSDAEYAAYLRRQGHPLPGDTPEGTLLGQVRRCALDNGWLFYHTYSSRRSDVGYVDCTIARPGSPLYLWELKSQHGKVTHEQAVWLDFLSQTTGVEVGLYRPDQWALLEAKLTQRSRP